MLYRLERVHKSFGTKSVLVGATWQHDPGRVVGLVGRNGAGKSTLLRIVQGHVEPDAGRVLLAGGTTFASLEQAVEPEGDEPLRIDGNHRGNVQRKPRHLLRFAAVHADAPHLGGSAAGGKKKNRRRKICYI